MKVFEILVGHPGGGGVEPSTASYYFGADTFDDALSLARQEYPKSRVLNCNEMGELYLSTEGQGK